MIGVQVDAYHTKVSLCDQLTSRQTKTGLKLVGFLCGIFIHPSQQAIRDGRRTLSVFTNRWIRTSQCCKKFIAQMLREVDVFECKMSSNVLEGLGIRQTQAQSLELGIVLNGLIAGCFVRRAYKKPLRRPVLTKFCQPFLFVR
jgi:hypothetical protein